MKAAAAVLGAMHIDDAGAREGLRWMDATLGNVSLLRFSPGDVPPVAFNRLNEHYREVVELSRLILRYRAIELERGGIRANGFLMDMNEVFQGFVTRALRESLKASDSTLRSDKNLPGTLWLDKGQSDPSQTGPVLVGRLHMHVRRRRQVQARSRQAGS